MALGAFFIIWSRFRQLRRYLSYRLDEENRIFRLLDYAFTGSLGHGPIHLLLQSAEEIGFFWDCEQAGWIRPGLPPLRTMTGPIQHFRSAIWQAWQGKVAADLSRRNGFRGGFSVDIYGSHQLLVSCHLRERDKMLLRAILSGGVWNGFLLSKVKKEDINCRFCNALTMTVIYSGIALFPSPFCGTSQQSGISSYNEQGSHPLASLLPLAWLASWADF